jgi:hypothetical protein
MGTSSWRSANNDRTIPDAATPRRGEKTPMIPIPRLATIIDALNNLARYAAVVITPKVLTIPSASDTRARA